MNDVDAVFDLAPTIRDREALVFAGDELASKAMTLPVRDLVLVTSVAELHAQAGKSFGAIVSDLGTIVRLGKRVSQFLAPDGVVLVIIGRDAEPVPLSTDSAYSDDLAVTGLGEIDGATCAVLTWRTEPSSGARELVFLSHALRTGRMVGESDRDTTVAENARLRMELAEYVAARQRSERELLRRLQEVTVERDRLRRSPGLDAVRRIVKRTRVGRFAVRVVRKIGS